MRYSQEFKEKVLKYFKGKEYEDMLESGSPWIGRYLDDSRRDIDADKLVQAYESKDSNLMHELYLEAKKMVELTNLYLEWGEMYRNENSKGGMGE